MTYSLDFRHRVVSFIEEGGSQREAQRIFKISRNTIYRWCTSVDLRPKIHGSRHRKLDKAALKLHVREHPDAKLSERAAHFDVHPSAIWYQLRKMNLVKKSA
jgi:putative transposase